MNPPGIAWLFRAVGLLVNSVLYLAAVIVVGIVEQNWWAIRLGIAAVGVTYLCYLLQLMADPATRVGRAAATAAVVALLVSMCAGLLAGAWLLVPQRLATGIEIDSWDLPAYDRLKQLLPSGKGEH